MNNIEIPNIDNNISESSSDDDDVPVVPEPRRSGRVRTFTDKLQVDPTKKSYKKTKLVAIDESKKDMILQMFNAVCNM